MLLLFLTKRYLVWIKCLHYVVYYSWQKDTRCRLNSLIHAGWVVGWVMPTQHMRHLLVVSRSILSFCFMRRSATPSTKRKPLPCKIQWCCLPWASWSVAAFVPVCFKYNNLSPPAHRSPQWVCNKLLEWSGTHQESIKHYESNYCVRVSYVCLWNAFWVYRFGTKSSHHFHCTCSSTHTLVNLLFGCKDSVPNLLIASIAAAALPP